MAKISGIDLSATTRPLLLVLVKDATTRTDINNPADIVIVVKDGTGTTLINSTIRLAYNTTGLTRIIALDLSIVSGKSGVTIEIYISGKATPYYSGYRTQYFDLVVIFDGGDYEYNVGIVGRNTEDRTITINIPDTDRTLPAGISRFSLSLATPPWYGNEDTDVNSIIATTDQGTLSILSTDKTNRHSNYGTFTTAPTYFNKIDIRVYPQTLTNYYAFDEKIVVVFMAGWTYSKIYVFNIKYTINGVNPPFATILKTVQYGTPTSESKDYTIKIHATTLDLAISVKFLSGSNTYVTSGTVKLEVWNETLSTKLGEASVDLTQGTELLSSYITGLPTDTNLIARIIFNVTATQRIILGIYLVFRVS